MSNTRYNSKLFSLVMHGIASLEKQAFTPMQPGQGNPPGGDPSQGAQPPMGAPPQGQPQMDPGMMAALQGGGQPSQEQPQPGMAPDGLPMNDQPKEEGGESGKTDNDDVKEHIRAVLTEAGVIKQPKLKPEEQFMWMRAAVEKICGQLGIKPPPLPDPANTKMDGSAGGGGGGAMTAGMSGAPSSQPMGSMDNVPLDPAQQAAAAPQGAPMAKAASESNISTKAASIRDALKRLRH